MKNFLLFTVLLLTSSMQGNNLHVAVASNFVSTLAKIVPQFEKEYQTNVVISSGATAVLFAQIMNGAPFDVFLAADQEHPKRLQQAGRGVDAPVTFAQGRLVLWTPGNHRVGEERIKNCTRIAIAQPDHAPYGRAALEVLSPAPTNLIRGANIAQAFHFVASGAVPCGFVALSQIYDFRAKGGKQTGDSDIWIVSQNRYEPLHHAAIAVQRNVDITLSKAFIAYLRSQSARKTIVDAGYRLP